MPDTTITQSVTTNYGTVIGAQYLGATADQIVEAVRRAGLLPRLTARLSEESFRRLLDIVGSATAQQADEMVRIYHNSLPATAHVLNNPIPPLLLADLCDQPLVKAWPPLIEFVERMHLNQQIELAMRAQLQQWVDAYAGQMIPPVPAYVLERLRKELQTEQQRADVDAPAWLQVYLEPDWRNRTQERKQPLFRVELVLSSSRTKGPLVLESGPQDAVNPQLWTLDELPALLDRTFANPEIVANIPVMSALIIEIVAPSDVLLFGFERWKRQNSQNTYAMFHPLVVRLRDRLTIPNPADQKLAWEAWHKKWNAFRNNLCQLNCTEMEWRTPEEIDLFDLLEDADLVCLGLASPLLPDRREVFDVLRDAGIPIALWLRGPDLPPMQAVDLPARISPLFQDRPLLELYRQVQRIRRLPEVRNDVQHIGNALTLLWDDPDRPPLKYEAQGVFV